jgi:hypothetical protein
MYHLACRPVNRRCQMLQLCELQHQLLREGVETSAHQTQKSVVATALSSLS